MVFKIGNYISEHTNKVSELLSSCQKSSMFLDDTIIRLDYRKDELWLTFVLGYTLSCNDLEELNAVFADFWWCVSPCFGGGEYRLAVCLKGVEV